VLVDILPDADGVPYLANGLIEAFEVTPNGRPTSGPGAQLDLASPHGRQEPMISMAAQGRVRQARHHQHERYQVDTIPVWL
jgi:hypothetical protein